MSNTYQESVEKTIIAAEQLHQIVNGTATSEVPVEGGSKIPTVRKALIDNFYFKEPLAWQQGQNETVFNQLRKTTDGMMWYAPGATVLEPVAMGVEPSEASGWRVYSLDAIVKLSPTILVALKRTYAEVGLNLNQGNFELGATLTTNTDVLLQSSAGKCFNWKGALPKVIPPQSTPEGTGGIGIGKWEEVTHVSLKNQLSDKSGSERVGFSQTDNSTIARTVQSKLRDTYNIKDFGALGDGSDCSAALALAVSAITTSSDNFDTITLEFPTGIYSYSVSPNFAIPRLEIRCSQGVVFNHTGSGNALVFDGGVTGGGVYCVKLTGDPLITGNASTVHGIYTRAVHHSKFEARVRNVTGAVLRTEWVVCNEYKIRSSPLGEPLFTVRPSTGYSLGPRAPSESTSACTFYNPCIGDVSGYGLNLQEAIMNTFIGGTIESSGGGLFIEAVCFGNTFINTDFEFNISTDIYCKGVNNQFIGILSDKNVEFTLSSRTNRVLGGRLNDIIINGVGNALEGVLYSTNGGNLADNGTDTVYSGVVSAVGRVSLPDKNTNPTTLGVMGASKQNGLMYGSSSSISGGTSNDVDLLKNGVGSAHLKGEGGVTCMSWNASGVGFYGAPPRSKPYVLGSTGGNPALTSLITQLETLGLINASGVTP